MVFILRKSLLVAGSSARIGPQLTDGEYLSQRKRFERDEIFTQYAVGIGKKILQVSLIHVIVKTGGVMVNHAEHVFSPLPPAVFF